VYVLPASADGAALAKLEADIRSHGGFAMTAQLTPAAIVQVLSSDVPGYAGSQLWCHDGIKAISDLRGRTIGINSRGSTPEVGVRVMLQRNGIKDNEWQGVRDG